MTIIRDDAYEERKTVLGNKQIINTAGTDSSVVKLELSVLAMKNNKKDETKVINETENLLFMVQI